MLIAITLIIKSPKLLFCGHSGPTATLQVDLMNITPEHFGCWLIKGGGPSLDDWEDACLSLRFCTHLLNLCMERLLQRESKEAQETCEEGLHVLRRIVLDCSYILGFSEACKPHHEPPPYIRCSRTSTRPGRFWTRISTSWLRMRSAAAVMGNVM